MEEPDMDMYRAASIGDLATLTAALAAPAAQGSVTAPFLLRQERVVNRKQPQSGNTVLHYAAAAGHAECVRFLLEQQADFDLRSRGGFIALHYASKMGTTDRMGVRARRCVRRQRLLGCNSLRSLPAHSPVL